MVRIICILIGYMCGLFQTGYIYGKIMHVDIRKYGSGNAGTTNALRTLGFKAGLITFLGDSLKAVLAAFLVKKLFLQDYADIMPVLILYSGLGTVLGHNFPCYLKFQGGKGIAATAGMIFAFNPTLTVIGFLTFVITVAITRYVSLGSILLMIGFFVELVVLGQMGTFELATTYLIELYVIAGILTGLALFRHRANISRLLNRTERKLGEKK